MSEGHRSCPHCGKVDGLSYYHEAREDDLYYCSGCYGLVVWDGEKVSAIAGEAYPNREK